MDSMRDDVGAAVVEALRAAGGDAEKVDRSAIVRRFAALGCKRSTAFRWIAAALTAHEEAKAASALPAIPIVTYPPAPAFRPGVGVPAAGLNNVMGGSGIAVVEKLMLCVQAGVDCMEHARHADGRVRISKTLIAASEHLRKTLETAARLHESMVSMQKLERYMDAMFAELEVESPDLAARVLARLKAVDATWRAGDEAGAG